MENIINTKTLKFMSLLNELAEDSKGGFLPLDAYNGTQDGIVYDTDVELKEYSSDDAKAYAVVSCVCFPDGQREVCYYGEDNDDSIDGEYQVVVEVEENPCGDYPIISCIVYLRDHETEAKLGDAVPGPLYHRIYVQNGSWTIE